MVSIIDWEATDHKVGDDGKSKPTKARFYIKALKADTIPEKPLDMDIANGSTLMTIDTQELLQFDEDSKTWK